MNPLPYEGGAKSVMTNAGTEPCDISLEWQTTRPAAGLLQPNGSVFTATSERKSTVVLTSCATIEERLETVTLSGNGSARSDRAGATTRTSISGFGDTCTVIDAVLLPEFGSGVLLVTEAVTITSPGVSGRSSATLAEESPICRLPP